MAWASYLNGIVPRFFKLPAVPSVVIHRSGGSATNDDWATTKKRVSAAYNRGTPLSGIVPTFQVPVMVPSLRQMAEPPVPRALMKTALPRIPPSTGTE